MELSKKVSSKFSRRRGEWSTGVKLPWTWRRGREGTELVGRPSTLVMPRVGPCEAVSGMSHGHPALLRRMAAQRQEEGLRVSGGHPQEHA